jgi:phage head maturation protease
MSEAVELGELEFRRQAAVAEVSFPRRLIELVVMPYETVAVVPYHGRVIEEICSRTAFDGIERRTSQIVVNRGHVIEAPIGRTVALHPSREEGLVAEVKISRTTLGEETLELAADGVLGASAGFGLLREHGRTGRLRPGAEMWETRSRRRLNHLWLDHIGMTPDPAYEGARVLAVRSAANPEREPVPDRPNLDRFVLDSAKALYEQIDARYGRP